MTTLTPEPLTVRPGPRVLMDTLVRATLSVPASYRPELPELTASAWRVCRDLDHPVTVAELAARLSLSPALAGVLVCDLAQLDLLRVVRFPDLEARLRSWASGSPAELPVPRVAKLLIVGDHAEDVRRCLKSLSGTSPLPLDRSPGVDIAVTRIAEDLHLLGIGVSGMDAANASWTDLCRHAFGALVITDPVEPARTADRAEVMRALGVPLAVLVPMWEGTESTPEQVREAVGLTGDVPVVTADLDSSTAGAGGLMDLCTHLENGGRR